MPAYAIVCVRSDWLYEFYEFGRLRYVGLLCSCKMEIYRRDCGRVCLALCPIVDASRRHSGLNGHSVIATHTPRSTALFQMIGACLHLEVASNEVGRSHLTREKSTSRHVFCAKEILPIAYSTCRRRATTSKHRLAARSAMSAELWEYVAVRPHGCLRFEERSKGAAHASDSESFDAHARNQPLGFCSEVRISSWQLSAHPRRGRAKYLYVSCLWT